jgi:hypothetical protein
MSSFKFTITLESDFTTQELADFFAALAQSERGNAQPLFRILHPVATPPAATSEPVVAPTEPAEVPAEPTPLATVAQPVPEPAVTDEIKRRLANTHMSCERLNSIIHRHNWARGQRARIERRWGTTKASIFARIGFHFNDYSIMDGSISTEDQLVTWLAARGYVQPL